MPLSSFKALSLIILILSLLSCEKDCLELAGADTSISQEFANFTKIEMHDTFTYHLIQDSANYVELRGKENLIKNAELQVLGNSLSIRKKQTCTLFKGYHDTEVFIHFKELNEIYIEGNASIYSEDTINVNNLRIENSGDFTTWDFKLKANNLKIYLHAIVGEMKLQGKVENMYLYSSGTNHCFFKKLEVKEASINHTSLGDIHLKVTEKLLLDINSSGDFYCYGNPPYQTVSYEENETGKLIFIN